jgi:hypothetical protein
MTRAQRLLVTAVAAVIVCAITSTAAFAAGFLGPGHFSTEFADASGLWFPDRVSPTFVQVSVDRNEFVFRPTQNAGGSSLMQHATILLVQFKGNTFGFGCFIIPDSAFVVGSDTQSASVSVTITDPNTACPGFAVPLGSLASGKPGGGPPPGGGIPLPLTVTATWSGNGATALTNSASQFSCGGMSVEDHFKVSSAQATSTVSLTMPGMTITTSPTDQANIDQGTDVSDVHGSPDPLCFGA